MDFYDQLMAYSFLKSGSLNLLLDNLPQPAPVARYKSGSEMMAEALTGRIRSDSSMFLTKYSATTILQMKRF